MYLGKTNNKFYITLYDLISEDSKKEERCRTELFDHFIKTTYF